MQRHTDLTQGSLLGHILRMTPPMIGAFFAMMVFHLADTWFVSRLGTIPLAAMGFTFPVLMLIFAIAMGLGLGTSARVSRALGAGDRGQVQHLATYSLLLAMLVLTVICLPVWIFVDFFLGLVGAEGEAAELAAGYLRILLVFIPLSMLPMIGNNAMRATGDTLRPSMVMALGAVLNIVLDPIFIFGWGPVPALGIRGAAWATGISRLSTLALSLYWMHHRFGLLRWMWDGWSCLFNTWGQVLYLAVPAAATNILMPLTFGVFTRLIARFGAEAVAATAAGQRIEHFVSVVPMAVGTVLLPIIGQNWGAGRVDRVRESWRKAGVFGVIYGLTCALLAWPLGGIVASAFSNDPRVIELIAFYLRIMLIGSSLLHLSIQTGLAFNAVQRPLHAAAVTASRMMLFILPLAWLGLQIGAVRGAYIGYSVGRLLSGITAALWFCCFLKKNSAGTAEKDGKNQAAAEIIATAEGGAM